MTRSTFNSSSSVFVCLWASLLEWLDVIALCYITVVFVNFRLGVSACLIHYALFLERFSNADIWRYFLASNVKRSLNKYQVICKQDKLLMLKTEYRHIKNFHATKIRSWYCVICVWGKWFVFQKNSKKSYTIASLNVTKQQMLKNMLL